MLTKLSWKNCPCTWLIEFLVFFILFSKNKVNHDLALFSPLFFSPLHFFSLIPCLSQWNYLKFLKHGMLFYLIMFRFRLGHTFIYIWQTSVHLSELKSSTHLQKSFPIPCLLGRDAHSLLHNPPVLTSNSAPGILSWRGLFLCLSPQYISSPLKTETGSYLIHASIWLTYNQHSANLGFVKLTYNCLN